MASIGCTVHAFDCTSNREAMEQEGKDGGVVFHPWWVGKQQSFEKNRYTEGKDSLFQFFSLEEIMRKLGHTQIDILNMDIEGFEWGVLEREMILGGTASPEAERTLPGQLLFELHTEKANPQFVPAAVVAGKDRQSVNRLFSSLYDLRYRVVNKEVNGGDLACAEFSMVLV